MIKVRIPNDNINERSYVIGILLGEFLGLKFDIVIENKSPVYKNWEIELDNGNKLIFEDHFFSKYMNDLEYLSSDNIPKKIVCQTKTDNKFLIEDDIPIIFGKNKFEIQDNNKKTCVVSGIDIFASSFFMLSRWEEYVNKKRDEHNRFSAVDSLALKNNFLDRPIVNEYTEMLWNMLSFLGINEEKKNRDYTIYLTHDVDAPLKYTSLNVGLREIAGDLLKRKNFRLAFNNLRTKLKVHCKLQNDPFDTFNYLMDISESIGVKSYFFFMGKGETTYDNYYKSNDKFIQKLIGKIKSRGHYIGIHPTYNAYNIKEQLKVEKDELEENLKVDIKFGREHYLRFEVPTTWQVWEDNNMQWDSTLVYADKEGFRCGVCYEYNVFNILTRKKLNLKEKPLIVMETSFSKYQSSIDPTAMIENIQCLIKKVKQYNGEFVLLWHNSKLTGSGFEKYKYIYEMVLK